MSGQTIDDESSPPKGLTAARELIFQEKVDAIFGGIDTPVSLAIVPLVNKEKKLFVRRNFKPVYEAPIAFDGDQPLGTHVYTATNAPADGTTLHWVIVSIASANPALIAITIPSR